MTWEVFATSMSTIVGMFVGGTAMAKLLDLLENRHPRTNEVAASRHPDSRQTEPETIRHLPT